MSPYEPPPPPPRPRRAGRLLSAFLAALLGAGVGAGTTWYVLDRTETGTGGGRVTPPVVTRGSAAPNLVADVAEAVMPSIVRIDVGAGLGEGTGSGVVYRSDGYIITNDHVVGNADSIQVRLATGELVDASLVGSAMPSADIAVVKLARTDLTAIRVGSSRALRVGDLAIAIGSPFGLEGTVTSGVVSALHRNITLGPGVRFTDAVQTDAPINPGNSGGALVNAKGELIGINTAIFSETGGNVGIGFAIPVDVATKVADQIIATGKASLPFLGISGETLPRGRGALLREVVPGGPAEDAGLKAGDVVVGIDGEKVGSMEDLIALLIERDVGDEVTVRYRRGASAKTARVQLAARPGD